MKLVTCPSCAVVQDFQIIEKVHGSWLDDLRSGHNVHCGNCGALVNDKVNEIELPKEEKRDGKKKG